MSHHKQNLHQTNPLNVTLKAWASLKAIIPKRHSTLTRYE